jgi:phosphohistidine phosphatase
VGEFLLRQGLKPDHVVSSPAKRAKQTVIAVCEQMEIDPEHIHWDSRIYHAGAGMLLNVLNDCPGNARRVLMAGHNPGLEILLQNLCNHDIPMPDDYKLMPTGAVAQLEILSDWENLEGGLARLVSLTRPASLPH